MISFLGTAVASGFKTLSGLDSETEVAERFAHPSGVVTDNKDDSGPYLVESEGIGFDFKGPTRPFAGGLIAYNGHAGLGGNAAGYQIEPTSVEIPNIVFGHGQAPTAGC